MILRNLSLEVNQILKHIYGTIKCRNLYAGLTKLEMLISFEWIQEEMMKLYRSSILLLIHQLQLNKVFSGLPIICKRTMQLKDRLIGLKNEM